MKKLISVLGLIVFVISIAGCGSVYKKEEGLWPYKQSLIKAVTPDALIMGTPVWNLE